MEPRISVVMVSDYEPEGHKTWKDEMALVDALVRQDINEPIELILVENERIRNEPVPDILFQLMPRISIFYYPSDKSSTLKDYGITVAKGEFVAVLESDCVPESNWLRLLMAVFDRGACDVASGRTWYGDETSYRRLLNLLHRSWDDPGESGKTQDISNNGAIYKREVLESFPYPDCVTPFISAEMRNAQINTAGRRCFYERNAVMRHGIGGYGFLWDYQRNKGHQRMTANHRQNFTGIPILVIRKTVADFRNALRLGGCYLRWFDWPLLPVLMLAELPPFICGTIDALRKVSAIPGSAYR